MLSAYICYTPGSSPVCSDTGSAHGTHDMVHMQTPLCSHSLTRWHPLSLAMQRGSTDSFISMLGLSRGSQCGPRARWQHHKETMLSLPPLQHTTAPLPNAAQCCSCHRLPCNHPWARPSLQAGGEHPAPIPCSCPGVDALHWMLCTDQSEAKRLQREAEKHWPGISRRERDEADFDAKSGREAESSRRGLIGRCSDLGALCKCLRSISAWNQIISTRATD